MKCLHLLDGIDAFMTPMKSRQHWHHHVRFALSTKLDTSVFTQIEKESVGQKKKSREECLLPPLPTPSINEFCIHTDFEDHLIPTTTKQIRNDDGDVINNNKEIDESFNQFNVVNDLVGVSERLLDTLDTTSSTFTTRNAKSHSSLARLSKAHHSMMAKTSNMRRQRFVTGKYPLYVSVHRNPTKKWLGYAESQIYLNGTSIEKSLASYDIFHWLDHKEREELHGDYEFLSLELLAEIHVKKPGYVNILPKEGAGKSLNQSGVAQRGGKDGRGKNTGKGVFGQWISWKLRSNDDSDVVEQKKIDDDSKRSNGERLWVTGFSLTNQRGEMHTLDITSGVISSVTGGTARTIKWPNEVQSIPRQLYTKDQSRRSAFCDSGDTNRPMDDALLVTDGFLVPGKDKGGLYVVRRPGNARSEWIDCLTGITNLQDVTINVDGGNGNWFYHRATWMDLTGDGRLSILAARAKILPLLNKGSSNGSYDIGSGGKPLGQGQLVWLECPKPHSIDTTTGTSLDKDGTVFDPFCSRNTPWTLRVLDEGPDVMFSVADLDPSDDTIEIIASQFFSKKLSLHSLKIGPDPKVVFSRIIDERCGSAFSSVLADLDGLATLSTHESNFQPKVVDSGSTVVSLKTGDAFSHLLVTSHECSFADYNAHVDSNLSRQVYMEVKPLNGDSHAAVDDRSKIDGGSLFAYRVPTGRSAWKTKPWPRSVIASGFKVEGQLSNMINPGAPGFCYTFFPTRGGGMGKDKKWHRPLIGLSGDCAESAYILRPVDSTDYNIDKSSVDKSTKYSLMCEIKCKATVGSLAIGYDDIMESSLEAQQQSGYAKIYVPCYEQDKVLVFSMGSGEDEYTEDDGS